MKPIIMLAPLAGYTNVAYRTFMKQFGCDIVVSEMISDFALIYQNKETDKMIVTSEKEGTVALQIFGGSKESILQGAKIMCEKAKFDYLDVNLGCPVHKVTKNNAGSSWLTPGREQELYEMMSALVKASPKPVTAKVRLGISQESINVVEVCKLLEKAGVAMITIHGRTKAQLYSGNADYEYIKKVKEIVKIPVIANGDINSLEKAIEVLNYTKADGIAIGRGCLGNPYLIKQISQYFEDGTILPNPTLEQQVEYLREHYYALLDLKGEYSATQEIRGIGSHYLKGFTHVKDYKVKLSFLKDREDFENTIKSILNDPEIERI